MTSVTLSEMRIFAIALFLLAVIVTMAPAMYLADTAMPVAEGFGWSDPVHGELS